MPRRRYKEGLESRGPGALDEKPFRTLRQPKGTVLRIAKVHPAWTSVLLATNEALEVRELRRAASGELQPPLASRDGAEPPLHLKWRRENIQVRAWRAYGGAARDTTLAARPPAPRCCARPAAPSSVPARANPFCLSCLTLSLASPRVRVWSLPPPPLSAILHRRLR